ncbi:hypothetical protein [Pseudovibrio flavus]|uniref:hypothetical protein n=1 Tax=Pseudovibrio flavus TaxID=2529854 RepID=UPI00211C6E34|nr:hypothetical protein [Pseudovibrio flavus]
MNNIHLPSAHVQAQISSVENQQRPLLIVDVDEVLFQFIPHLERYAAQKGIAFKDHSYSLRGNLHRTDTGAPLKQEEAWRLLNTFFDEQSHQQAAVEHAPQQLERLSDHFQIVILTNLPGPHNAPVRKARLEHFGMPYPMIVNEGPKGGAVAALSAGRGKDPVVFVDDSHSNLISASKAAPHVKLVQFIADKRFHEAAPLVEAAALKSNCWLETGDFILSLLDE